MSTINNKRHKIIRCCVDCVIKDIKIILSFLICLISWIFTIIYSVIYEQSIIIIFQIKIFIKETKINLINNLIS
jgi:hypothetical protein